VSLWLFARQSEEGLSLPRESSLEGDLMSGARCWLVSMHIKSPLNDYFTIQSPVLRQTHFSLDTPYLLQIFLKMATGWSAHFRAIALCKVFGSLSWRRKQKRSARLEMRRRSKFAFLCAICFCVRTGNLRGRGMGCGFVSCQGHVWL
jgi:hypothetical protein